MQTPDDRVKWSKVRAQSLVSLNSTANFIKTFYREILLLRYLCHPNISSLLGVDQNTFNGIPSVVSEWMPHGDIRTYIQNNNPSQRKLSCLVGTANPVASLPSNSHLFVSKAAEIAAGLAYLHKENVVHGDLHGVCHICVYVQSLISIRFFQRNILIDEQEHARLIDFGLSNFADSSTESGCSRYGATKWMAPELLCPSQFGLSRVRHTPASDIYSYSCVLWQVTSLLILLKKIFSSTCLCRCSQAVSHSTACERTRSSLKYRRDCAPSVRPPYRRYPTRSGI